MPCLHKPERAEFAIASTLRPVKTMLKQSDNRETETKGILASYRVLDLTGEKGFLCGKILAELGADVIKIEPPGGGLRTAYRPLLS